MTSKLEAEKVVNRFNDLITMGSTELDADLLKKAIELGIEFELDVSKLTRKLEELTKETAIHLKS